MKKIVIFTVLIVINIYAQKIDNHSVIVDESEIVKEKNSKIKIFFCIPSEAIKKT